MAQVSVIMPARNAASTIQESIRTVLATDNVGELIIVDDQSSDNTAQLVCALNDSRIRLLRGCGEEISAALNIGFGAARGEFVARCDADDLYPSDRFAWQLPLLLNRPEIVAISGGFRTITWRGHAIADLACNASAEDITETLINGIPRSHFCTWLTRRSTIEAVGGARKWFMTAEDLDLMFRIASQGIVWHEPKLAYLYRLHESSIVHKQASNIRIFFEESARRFAVDRASSGKDDLDRGAPPALPLSDGRRMSAREQTVGMLIGSAWSASDRGDRRTGALQGLKALALAPLSANSWKQFALLLIKRSRKSS